MLGDDARSKWDIELLADSRVRHYWNADRLVGTWFAEEVVGFDGVVWDAYYLYDARARWNESPLPAISTGSTHHCAARAAPSHITASVGVLDSRFTMNSHIVKLTEAGDRPGQAERLARRAKDYRPRQPLTPAQTAGAE
jgi:hypothetical protein